MIAAILVALGLASVGWASFQMFRVRRAARWTTVRATIRAAAEGEHEALMGAIEQRHAFKLRYVYEYEDRLYTGDRLYFGDELVRPRGPAALHAGEMASGTEISVRVNPRNPGDSVVDARVHSVLPRVAISGVALTLLGPLISWMERSAPFRGAIHDDYVAIAGVAAAIFWIRRSES